MGRYEGRFCQSYHRHQETLSAKEANNVFLLSDDNCVFPFIYGNKKHFDCTYQGSIFPWCSLNADYRGRWKYCTNKGKHAACPHARSTWLPRWRGKVHNVSWREASGISWSNPLCSIPVPFSLFLGGWGAMLSLCCWVFSSCSKWVLLFAGVWVPRCGGFSCWGA